MKAARLRIAGEGELVKEWKRLFGLRSSLEESFLLFVWTPEIGGISLAGWPEDSNAVLAFCLVD
jgi:hypothetical protein